jgi:hypothetical protein
MSRRRWLLVAVLAGYAVSIVGSGAEVGATADRSVDLAVGDASTGYLGVETRSTSGRPGGMACPPAGTTAPPRATAEPPAQALNRSLVVTNRVDERLRLMVRVGRADTTCRLLLAGGERRMIALPPGACGDRITLRAVDVTESLRLHMTHRIGC